MPRWLGCAALAVAATAAAAWLSLAVPVPTWRTGDQGLERLRYDTGFGIAPQRVWIDTDAACGHGARVDPDDCLAIALLARTPGIEVVGLSTVFGNADRAVVDATVGALLSAHVADGGAPVPVWPGADAPAGRSAAPAALASALDGGPLTIVALGPLTNVAAALRERPQRAAHAVRLVTVMGRRPGHLFHPAEGAPARSFLGHGPVFRDFNFALDVAAAQAVLDSAVAITLVPYDAARTVEFGPAGVATLTGAGPFGRWLARRLQPWLGYWRDEIGRAGFLPFDLVAAVALVEPASMRCATVRLWIGPDDHLLLPGLRPTALLVADAGSPAQRPARSGLYCAAPAPAFAAVLQRRLGAAAAPAGAEAAGGR